MPAPGRQWYHCTIHTYGAWLPSDERGFRTRHHREHVDGDYKNPPPEEMYDELKEHSHGLMKQEEVEIPEAMRSIVGEALIEVLKDQLGAEVLALSVSNQHVHLLAKMPAGEVPRQWIGRAKKHSNFVLKEHGWSGKLWGTRSYIKPVKDSEHHKRAFAYILKHKEKGAWIWSFRDAHVKGEVQSPPTAVGGLSAVSLSATSLLQQLVQIPSVNPMGRTDIPAKLLFEDRIIDSVESILKRRNIPCLRTRLAEHRSNLVASYMPENPQRHLLFESHLDTVPIDGMTIDPFAASIVDNKLYGRGACDVKAGASAMLAAFLRICKENTCKHRITLALTADEEHTFLGVEALAREIENVDFAIVAEPTDLNIVVAHKGVARFTTTVRGQACHSSAPKDGLSAIYRMAKVLLAIQAYAETLSGSSISVGTIVGGVSSNTVPDRCTIEVDRRLVPGETAESALADFNAMLESQRFGFPTESEITFQCPPLAPMPADHPLLNRLISAIGSPALVHAPYGTDASILAAAGVPCVVFGPGSIAQAHTHDEWVDLVEVENAAEILYRFATSEE